METLPIWFTLPQYLPFDTQICWIRIKYYYSNPFLAVWDNALKQFTSVDNTIVYPAWTIARWREYSNTNDLSFTLINNQDPLNVFSITMAGMKYFAYSIDWGDGNSISGYWKGSNETFTHEFTTTGNKNIVITMPSASLIYLSVLSEPLAVSLPDLSDFFNLETIAIVSCDPGGNIYSSFPFEKIKYLSLRNNDLLGIVPSTSNLPLIEHFDVSSNSFPGSVFDFSSNSKLSYVAFLGITLSGTLPDFSMLPLLSELYVQNNLLSGSLPNFLLNTSINIFRAFNNNFSGDIPDISSCALLTQYRIYTNQLTGSLLTQAPLMLIDFQAQNNLLSETAVNSILAAFVLNLNLRPVTGILNLAGTGNAPPAAQGLIDKAAIIAHGWTVTTN
jgi:hypothetical protein